MTTLPGLEAHGAGLPEGMTYRAEVVTPDEERGLLAWLETLELVPVVLHGQPSRRLVRHYGYDYAYEARDVARGEPLPDELRWVQARAAEVTGIEAEALAETLITFYPAGAGIGWHRDAPMFDRVAGLSLGSPCRMRFQRGKADKREVLAVELEPRSVYVLTGASRWSWQHGITTARAPRWSVTFRSLRSVGSRP